MTDIGLLLAPKITLGGSPLKPQDALVSIRIERGLGVIGRATLRFDDAGFTLSTDPRFKLGAQLEITVDDKATFEGQISGVSLEQRPGESTDFVVVADDVARKLAHSVKPATYLNMQYSDVISKLCRDAGFSAQTSGSRLNGVNPYQLRTGTGLQYLDQVTRRTGTVWWVEGKTLHVDDAGTSTGTEQLTLGTDLTEFSVRASGLRPIGARVTGWNVHDQQAIVGTSPARPVNQTSALVSDYAGQGPHIIGGGDVSTAEWFPVSLDEADVLAEALRDEARAAAVVARGRCWANPAIKPSVTVKIQDAGPASGSYLVSEVEHLYNRHGFYTRFVAGPFRPAGLVDTLGRAPSDSGFAINGLVVGQVTDNNDPDSQGRVMIKYVALDGEPGSTWARVVTIGGGAQRGVVMQPEIGDEVLVGFEYGDTRRPVVIGGLFSPKNDLPEAKKIVAGGKVDYRRITSRKNHVIEIADGDQSADQHILLKLGTAAHSVLLGAEKFEVEVASGKPVTIKAGSAKFEISASGDVTIEGNNVTIKAQQKLQLEGVSAQLKGTAQTQVQGATVAVKADGLGSVEASGPLTLKGAIVKIN
ncbi:MAG TPA: phage baseplate assembly protein V [Jatrophihabitantaceae bacterium]|nr:phage baseplate assembly protein V [Jatrophihabitantaceae bacterium]